MKLYFYNDEFQKCFFPQLEICVQRRTFSLTFCRSILFLSILEVSLKTSHFTSHRWYCDALWLKMMWIFKMIWHLSKWIESILTHFFFVCSGELNEFNWTNRQFLNCIKKCASDEFIYTIWVKWIERDLLHLIISWWKKKYKKEISSRF